MESTRIIGGGWGSLRKMLDAAKQAHTDATADTLTVKPKQAASTVVLDPKAPGGEREMTMLEKLRAGVAKLGDLYHRPKLFGLRGRTGAFFQSMDGRVLYMLVPGTMTVRRVAPIKVRGKAAAKRYKRARRATREHVAWLRAKQTEVQP